MAENKGKPSGPDADNKSEPGRKSSEYKRFGWPEDANTQRVPRSRNSAPPGEGRGRNRKAGSPV